MTFKLESGEINKLNILSKTYRTTFSYLTTDDFDLDCEHDFVVYDSNDSKLGYFETSIAPVKPIINIRRIKLNSKDLQVQEEIFESFMHYLWDYHNTQHLILKIQIDSLGSGINPDSLIHLGFCDHNYKRENFSKLNPLYPNLVETFAENEEVKDELIDYFHHYEFITKKRMQRNLENAFQSANAIINDTTLSLEEKKLQEQYILYYSEALYNLNANTTTQQKKIVLKK